MNRSLDVIEWWLGSLILVGLVGVFVTRWQNNHQPDPLHDEVLDFYDMTDEDWARMRQGVMDDIKADIEAEQRRGRFELVVPESAEVIEFRRRGGAA